MKHSRRDFLITSGMAAAVLSRPAKLRAAAFAQQQPGDVMFFEQPAIKWPDALPVGNGRLGAMVFGTVGTEHLQLNEDSVWDGEVRDRNNPAAGNAVPEIRRLLFAGKVHEAERLAASSMLAIPLRLPMNETLGDLWLDFHLPEPVSKYRRDLDLRTALSTVSFHAGGVGYHREIFSSAPDQVIVVRLDADKKSALSFTAKLDRPASFATTTGPHNDLVMSGTAFPPVPPTDPAKQEREVGIRFHCNVRILPEGGTVTAVGNHLHVQGANAVTLLIAAATSHDAANMPQACTSALDAAARIPYKELRTRHVRDYQRYYNRSDVTFTSGVDPLSNMPTDKRLERVKQGKPDEFLLQTYYRFGRYLLIGSSRPGTLAANLQGIWNNSINPPWGCKYTVNINAEMNYWMAEAGNLADLHTPLFDLLDSTRAAGAVTAERYYRSRGFVVHHNTDIWGDSVPIDGVPYGIWPMGAAWLATHLWEHYLFSHDREFLKKRAYPRLREIARFFLDYLVESPSGHLVTGPSLSPENRYRLPDGTTASLCMGPTMDIEITRAVFMYFIAGSDILGLDKEMRGQADTAMKRLPPIPISPEGRIQEWPVDYKETEPGHRHISHLWALYPNDQITLRGTPKLAAAARKSLERRLAYGGGSTGWSRAWIVNCWARLEDGEQAHKNLHELLKLSTLPNLLDVCGEKPTSYYQIDGNLGAPAGILEMLLQSHSGIVRFLPALPKAWPDGSFRGLRARGGLEVSLAWKDGKAMRATLRATQNGKHQLSAGGSQRVASVAAHGKSMPLEHTKEADVIFHARAGETYHIRFA